MQAISAKQSLVAGITLLVVAVVAFFTIPGIGLLLAIPALVLLLLAAMSK